LGNKLGRFTKGPITGRARQALAKQLDWCFDISRCRQTLLIRSIATSVGATVPQALLLGAFASLPQTLQLEGNGKPYCNTDRESRNHF
jgi:hypothetical protein